MKYLTSVGVDTGITKKSPVGISVMEFYTGETEEEAARKKTGRAFRDSRAVEPFNMDEKWFHRLPSLHLQIEKAIVNMNAQNADILTAELPYYGANIQTTIKLAAVLGVCAAIADKYDMIFMAVTPSQAKEAMTRNGKATKTDMQNAVKVLAGKRLSSHESDATGVAIAGPILAGLILDAIRK